MLLGFAEDGSCPMYQSRACSIYAQRPRTCRDYDCRIFSAAGIDAGDGHDAINERVRAWAFTYESAAAVVEARRQFDGMPYRRAVP